MVCLFFFKRMAFIKHSYERITLEKRGYHHIIGVMKKLKGLLDISEDSFDQRHYGTQDIVC